MRFWPEGEKWAAEKKNYGRKKWNKSFLFVLFIVNSSKIESSGKSVFEFKACEWLKLNTNREINIK